jgi:hypothetical protein
VSAVFSDTYLDAAAREAIHRFALRGREILSREARDLLEGVYGLHADGSLEPAHNLPALADPEARQLYQRIQRFTADEVQAGLAPAEAVSKLAREVAFTHLNRLVAFKMLESSRLIREAVGRGPGSNGFKFYLADHPEAEQSWRSGAGDAAYRRFLLWQAGEIAAEIPVLFDPENLASGLFPRPPALAALLDLLNAPELSPAWQAEETIGWVYQYFNEQEKSRIDERLNIGGEVNSQDLPAKTQLFTPRWIVRYLVENTLGRLWICMHPDSTLRDSLHYLVPLADGNLLEEHVRPVREITLLDPACGTMHFGLVAFDLFAAMYQEEIDHAGKPGWPEIPSTTSKDEIASAIIENNLHGIDIDLRAVQLSALTLYLKAKRFYKKTRITDHNLACVDVMPYSTADLGRFILQSHFTDPIFERMLRRIREQLKDIQQVGSLLRIEREISHLVEEQRHKAAQKRQAKSKDKASTASLWSEEETVAMESDYYSLLEAQLLQALDLFRQQAANQGDDMQFFTGEAGKSLRILDLFLHRYDVIVTNPPYLDSRDMNEQLKVFLERHYSNSKRNLYSAFVERALELLDENGRLGILTGQTFMFISSFEQFRKDILQGHVIETLAQFDYGLFKARVDTAAFVLRREADARRRRNNVGNYFRLVHAPDPDSKRIAFEKALAEIKTR